MPAYRTAADPTAPTVADEPRGIEEDNPSKVFPCRLGRLNVLDISPWPQVIPIAEKRLA